jgi:DNA polymerase-3 subunit alpha
MRASSIEDLTAIVALYRPGPMESIPRFIASKLDPGKISYLHPSLKPILKVTYGCIVYQEQVSATRFALRRVIAGKATL